MQGLVSNFVEKVKKQLHKTVVGQEDVIEEIMAGLLTKGHILVEGVPGIAKTLLSKTLARSLSAEFKRIQFTPDLMPSDVIGTNVFDSQTGSFKLRRGPVFTDILLADEINRTPPKTQSALLEAMEERQVSIDGECFNLSDIFFVVATQNPIEYEGTYPLPEAQLDRFMLKVIMSYPDASEEKEIYSRFNKGFDPHDLEKAGVEAVADFGEIKQARTQIQEISVTEEIINYIYEIVQATRKSLKLILGPSPRAATMLLLASKAKASLEGKDFVSPDDVKRMAHPVLRHRLILKPEAEVEGIRQDNIVDEVLSQVKVPR